MVITEVITVFGHNNMQRNEMAPFQKKKEIIRYIAAESLEFDQENSLITVITLFFPLSPQIPVIQFFSLYIIALWTTAPARGSNLTYGIQILFWKALPFGKSKDSGKY